MRLKVSAKEALLKIDLLIQEWWIIFDDIKNFVLSLDDNIVYDVDTPELSQLAFQDQVIWTTKVSSNEIHISNKLKEELESIKSTNDLHNADLSTIKDFQSWHSKACNTLDDIFQDFSPVYTFKKAKAIYDESYTTQFPIILTIKLLEMKLDLLNNFYEDIAKDFKSPLLYLDDKSQIHFYNIMIQLWADNNESTLCKYMFQFPIWELIPYEDIYCYITWLKADQYSDNLELAITKVSRAYEWVNKEALKVFWFSIFKKNKLLLSLTLPNRFVKEL